MTTMIDKITRKTLERKPSINRYQSGHLSNKCLWCYKGTLGVSHSLKLFVPRCEADVRTRFFSVRVINLWNGLPDYVVSFPSIDSFKRSLDCHLGPLLFVFD